MLNANFKKKLKEVKKTNYDVLINGRVIIKDNEAFIKYNNNGKAGCIICKCKKNGIYINPTIQNYSFLATKISENSEGIHTYHKGNDKYELEWKNVIDNEKDVTLTEVSDEVAKSNFDILRKGKWVIRNKGGFVTYNNNAKIGCISFKYKKNGVLATEIFSNYKYLSYLISKNDEGKHIFFEGNDKYELEWKNKIDNVKDVTLPNISNKNTESIFDKTYFIQKNGFGYIKYKNNGRRGMISFNCKKNGKPFNKDAFQIFNLPESIETKIFEIDKGKDVYFDGNDIYELNWENEISNIKEISLLKGKKVVNKEDTPINIVLNALINGKFNVEDDKGVINYNNNGRKGCITFKYKKNGVYINEHPNFGFLAKKISENNKGSYVSNKNNHNKYEIEWENKIENVKDVVLPELNNTIVTKYLANKKNNVSNIFSKTSSNFANIFSREKNNKKKLKSTDTIIFKNY